MDVRYVRADLPMSTIPGAPVAKLQTKDEWSEAQRIQDLPDVDDAMRGFIIDTTGNNGTIVARAVMRAILAAKEQA
jgi:hypothetical protein